jgi:hypothetical protein
MTQEKPELVFADLKPGRLFRPLRFEVSPEVVRRFMDTIGDRHRLYSIDPDGAGPLAPPGLAAIYARSSYLQDNSMPSGGVLAKQEFEFEAPARVGDTLTVRAEVAESYVDPKGRKRVNYLIQAFRPDGRRVSLIRLYAIWPK